MPARASSEVVVVGGGLVGCASAAFLAEGGARVTLVEATELGAGASGRNLGAVQHPFDPVLADLHAETVGIYRELDGFPLADRPAGLLLLTDDPAAGDLRAAELSSYHPELAPEVLDEVGVRTAEPIVGPGWSAIRLATGWPVPPDAAVRAFARRAAAAGADLRIGEAAGRIIVVLGRAAGIGLADGSTLAADMVLVAAGPWTPELLDPSGTWRPIVRTWGVTVQVEVPPARHVLEEGVVHTVNRVVDNTDATDSPAGADESAPILFSMVSAGGITTVGSTFLPDQPDPARLAPRIVDHGAHVVPALSGAPMVRVRACARPQSFDGRPLVGQLPGVGGLFLAAGHGPWGVSTGPAAARLVADLMLGRGPAIPAALSAERVPPPQLG
jgi:glycine oxidase